jgi:hypothetical protein
MKAVCLISAGALLLAACAAPGARMGARADASATPPRQCFWTRQVNGFTAVDERTVNVRVGTRDYYQLELLGPCRDVDWALALGLESRGGSSICTGLDATIIAPSSIGPQRCPVRNVRKLTPQEVAALHARP